MASLFAAVVHRIAPAFRATAQHPSILFPAVLAIAAGVAAAQPTITNLDVLAGGSPTFSYAEAISADGQVVTGSSSSSSGQRAFRWTAAGGMQNLSALSGFTVRSTAQAISADGSVIACISTGANNTARACRWTAPTNMQSIGILGTGSASYARAISADGSIIVGSSYTTGFTGPAAMRWSAATGMQTIGGTGAAPAAITPDGSVIVGTDNVDGYNTPARWVSSGATGVPQHLIILTGADSGEVFATSADGSKAAGYSGDQLNGTFKHAVRWTGLTGSGAIQDLGTLGGGSFSHADAMSADGSVVGGASTLPSGDHAFLWTSTLGLIDLNTYLPSLGLDLTGWTLTGVRGISADGSAIVGYATFNGADRAFLVRGLPTPCASTCAADFNCSGHVEVQDIFDFLGAWFAGEPRADFNGQGGVAVQDIFDFLRAWFIGC